MQMKGQKEFLKGVQLALAGDIASAIEAFRRSREIDPDALDPAVNLFQAYQDGGRWQEARDLAKELQQRWPGQPAILVALAKWHQRRGRPAEALALIRDPHVDLGLESHAFPVYLSLLLANSRFEEALLEAERGLTAPLWHSQAMLAKGAALLHFGDLQGAIRLFEQLASEGFGKGDPLRAGLLPVWVSALRRAGAFEQAKELLDEARKQYPNHNGLRALAAE